MEISTISLTDTNLPPIQTCRPRTFRERGLVGSFTTPTLSGARLRIVPNAATYSSDRAISQIDGRTTASGCLRGPVLEVVVPNPSGGRGVYILPWNDIGRLCRPTMHDVILGRVLTGLLEAHANRLTPALVREASWQTAAQGLAGREAAQAAERAIQRRQSGLVATRFTLLMEITEQSETPPAACRFVDASPDEIERRGREALARRAQELAVPAQSMPVLLDILADAYVDMGIGLGMAEASQSKLVADLGILHHDLMGVAQLDGGIAATHAQADARDALGVAAAAELAARMARALLEAVRLRVRDMPGLMATVIAAPDEVIEQCVRVLWLLDGWSPVCRLWHAPPELLPRHVALQEMATRIPVLPDEVETWLGLPGGIADKLFRRSTASFAASQREVSLPERIARQERLLAMAF